MKREFVHLPVFSISIVVSVILATIVATRWLSEKFETINIKLAVIETQLKTLQSERIAFQNSPRISSDSSQ